MNITVTTLNFHIIFKFDSLALIFFDVANGSQASWKIYMFIIYLLIIQLKVYPVIKL